MSGDAGGPEAGAGLPPPPPDAMLDAQGAATALWLQQSAPAGTDALPPSVSVDGTVSASWLQAMHAAASTSNPSEQARIKALEEEVRRLSALLQPKDLADGGRPAGPASSSPGGVGGGVKGGRRKGSTAKAALQPPQDGETSSVPVRATPHARRAVSEISRRGVS